MNKKQLIALFEAMEDNTRTCAEYYESADNHDAGVRSRGVMSAYGTIIMALKSPKFAKELAEIYEVAI